MNRETELWEIAKRYYEMNAEKERLRAESARIKEMQWELDIEDASLDKRVVELIASGERLAFKVLPGVCVVLDVSGSEGNESSYAEIIELYGQLGVEL